MDAAILLKKVFPTILKKPEILLGYDVSQEEVDTIVDTGKVSLDVLENLGGDHFFILNAEIFGISEGEAEFLDYYLEQNAFKDKDKLISDFSFIVE